MKRKKIIKLIIITIISISFLLLYKYLYEKYSIGIPCIFHKITKLYCPGCGITRAIFYLMKLDIKKSLQCNILLYILSPFLLIYTYNYIKIWLNETKKDPSKIISKKIWYSLLLITLLFGIVRNIEYFSWLRPI